MHERLRGDATGTEAAIASPHDCAPAFKPCPELDGASLSAPSASAGRWAVLGHHQTQLLSCAALRPRFCTVHRLYPAVPIAQPLRCIRRVTLPVLVAAAVWWLLRRAECSGAAASP